MKPPSPDQWAEHSPAASFLDELARHISLAPLHETLQNVVSFTTSLVKCDSCFVYVREGDELVLRASMNPHPEIVDRLKLKFGEGITGWVAQHKKPVAVAVNASEDPRFKVFNDLPEDHFESFLSVPVVTRGRLVGVINMQNLKPHRYTARQIGLISMIGALAGAEIEMARLEGESAQDLTARKKAEDERKILENQLHQSQKMEAVGRLSAGVAHDFNNLLGVIIGYSEDLEDRLDKNSPLRKHAEQIKKAGQRAAALTRQLLAFSRQQVLEPKILSLNHIIEDLRKMLPRLLGADIETQTTLDPALAAIKADPGQIEQVIINLAVNARDAMPDGGKLAIETRNLQIEDGHLSKHPTVPQGNYAVITVSDTGTGMDAQVQAHIFEPFFTTKEQGKGTGLGLATVYGVVKQSGGYIWVDSAPGLGTTFTIYLPRADESARRSADDVSMAALKRGSETILLVEDEDDLRTLTGTLLEQGGYTVLEANSGSPAVEVARQHRGLIHLLLTDVVMPGMNGRAAAKILAEIRPKMRVLYTSGYAQFSQSGAVEAMDNFLPKPFTRESLLRKVDDVLHTAGVAQGSAERET